MLDAAAVLDADVIITGTRSLHGVREVIVGTLSHGLIQHSHLPSWPFRRPPATSGERAVSDAADIARETRRRWIALIVVCLAMLMNTLDATVVNVALPKIQHDLHFTQAGLAWVIDSYMVAFGGFLLMSGRLGDLIGRKRVFLVGVCVFTVASLVCGIASSQGLLVGARFVQGFGGALSTSMILAIVATESPEPQERAQAMSAYIFVTVGGGSLGLLAGGLITQALNWHWIFFINLPIGVATFTLGCAPGPRERRARLASGESTSSARCWSRRA